jgi:chloramphenicol O-acetyltransferase type B
MQLRHRRSTVIEKTMVSGMRHFLNMCRNILMFRIRFPWVKRGRNVHCQFSAYFWSPRRHIVLGDVVQIGPRCVFLADTVIGNKVMVAAHVAFLNSDDHRYDVVGTPMWDSGRGDAFEIHVEDDVWIGFGSIILSPAKIGRGAIVAAGSVVTKDVPRYAIVAGVPARVLKMRFTPEQISLHESILGYTSGDSDS